jgi:hypothetical protein
LPPELFAPVPAQQVKAPATRAQRIRDAIDRRCRSLRSRTVEAKCIERDDATLTTLIVLCTYKNIFLLFFETPCDVASAQRALKKRV